jgi:hypothetical protein
MESFEQTYMEIPMTETGEKPWFGMRSRGYGVNPQTWQGWLTLVVFAVLLLVDMTSLESPVRWLGLIVLSAALFAIMKWKSSGTWRWRWGPSQD